MGKTDPSLNRPTNGSLSYTLEYLRTFIELEPAAEGALTDVWEPLFPSEIRELGDWGVDSARVNIPLPRAVMKLSPAGELKFLKFLRVLKEHFGIQETLKVRTINNFPSDCGIASSASSFAALTAAVAQYAGKENDPSLPMLSARGSGSSSRSFFGPWCEWTEAGVIAPNFALRDLVHGVILVSEQVKTVSSSQAHLRVGDSLNFQGRPERAEKRLTQLKKAIAESSWRLVMEISWAEFWDMHSLFETAQPSFGYLMPGSFQVLQAARKMWEQQNDGPVVTMDAGANVHVFWRRNDQADLVRNFREELKGFEQIWSES